ncbi:MAG TPA: hypothetical protein VIK91_18475 [Nannocystis sp.]
MLKRIRVHLLLALVGASFGCREDADAPGGVVTTAEIKTACESYCARAKACDVNTDLSMCLDDCRDRMADCMQDEQRQAVDDLTDCSAETCDEFTRCAIGAGLQCSFGI